MTNTTNRPSAARRGLLLPPFDRIHQAGQILSNWEPDPVDMGVATSIYVVCSGFGLGLTALAGGTLDMAETMARYNLDRRVLHPFIGVVEDLGEAGGTLAQLAKRMSDLYGGQMHQEEGPAAPLHQPVTGGRNGRSRT